MTLTGRLQTSIQIRESRSSARSKAMVFCPDWPNRGLAWIEAFDNVPLMALLQTMVDLDLFRPTTISAMAGCGGPTRVGTRPSSKGGRASALVRAG